MSNRLSIHAVSRRNFLIGSAGAAAGLLGVACGDEVSTGAGVGGDAIGGAVATWAAAGLTMTPLGALGIGALGAVVGLVAGEILDAGLDALLREDPESVSVAAGRFDEGGFNALDTRTFVATVPAIGLIVSYAAYDIDKPWEYCAAAIRPRTSLVMIEGPAMDVVAVAAEAEVAQNDTTGEAALAMYHPIELLEEVEGGEFRYALSATRRYRTAGGEMLLRWTSDGDRAGVAELQTTGTVPVFGDYRREATVELRVL